MTTVGVGPGPARRERRGRRPDGGVTADKLTGLNPVGLAALQANILERRARVLDEVGESERADRARERAVAARARAVVLRARLARKGRRFAVPARWSAGRVHRQGHAPRGRTARRQRSTSAGRDDGDGGPGDGPPAGRTARGLNGGGR